jgi:pyruvate/2-oxoglutarate dehydrogenase complex dihydrolipoamide acyltransferase (E2) component
VKAEGFLNALGKGDDEEEDVPRKRRPRKTAEAAPPAADPAEAPADEGAPAPVEAPSAPPVPDPDPAPQAAAAPTPSQQRAAERRAVIEPDGLAGVPPELAALIQTVQDALAPDSGPGLASDEPVHKTSVDLRWTLKKGLADLVARDRRGPKAELNDAVELWLHIKGIDVPKWNG